MKNMYYIKAPLQIIETVSDKASRQRILLESKQMNALLMLTCFCWSEEEISAMLSLPH